MNGARQQYYLESQHEYLQSGGSTQKVKHKINICYLHGVTFMFYLLFRHEN